MTSFYGSLMAPEFGCLEGYAAVLHKIEEKAHDMSREMNPTIQNIIHGNSIPSPPTYGLVHTFYLVQCDK